jgi:hypothetical protein
MAGEPKDTPVPSPPPETKAPDKTPDPQPGRPTDSPIKKIAWGYRQFEKPY